MASLFHAKARTGALRRHLITVPALIARRSRRITLRLPLNWPHRDAFDDLFTPPTPHQSPLTSETPSHQGPTGDATVEELDSPAVSVCPQAHHMIHNTNSTKMITQRKRVDPGLVQQTGFWVPCWQPSRPLDCSGEQTIGATVATALKLTPQSPRLRAKTECYDKRRSASVRAATITSL